MSERQALPESSHDSIRKGVGLPSFEKVRSTILIGTIVDPKNTSTESIIYLIISLGFLLVFISTISAAVRESTAS